MQERKINVRLNTMMNTCSALSKEKKRKIKVRLNTMMNTCSALSSANSPKKSTKNRPVVVEK